MENIDLDADYWLLATLDDPADYYILHSPMYAELVLFQSAELAKRMALSNKQRLNIDFHEFPVRVNDEPFVAFARSIKTRGVNAITFIREDGPGVTVAVDAIIARIENS